MNAAHGTTVPRTLELVMGMGTQSVAVLLDEAVTLLDRSLDREGWFGPARGAYDALAEELRSRLVVLAVRARAIA